MEGRTPDTTNNGGVIDSTPLFVAAAHELKSPLALMRQLALELETGGLSTSDIKKIAHHMKLTSERALRLTTNLTKQTRLEDSLFTMEPVNPLSLCDEVIDEIQPLYKARGRTLELMHRRRTLLGIANKDLLRRILLNFVDNALHYSACDTPVRVGMQATRGGEYIRLSVRDYGPAIPRDTWKHLNSDVGAGRQHMHARPESSGLGVYISGQFAKAMNAHIGATRHSDGVTFYVDIRASGQLRLL